MGLMQVLGESVLRLLAARLLSSSARIVEQVSQLVREGKNEEALERIEIDAGLVPAVYADRNRLADRLGQRLREDDPDWAAIYVSTLAGANTATAYELLGHG